MTGNVSSDMRSVAPCGTYAAHNRHLRNGEKPCDPCRTAANTYQREKRAKNREAHNARDRAAYRRRRDAAGLKPVQYRDLMPNAIHAGRCGTYNYTRGCPGCADVRRARMYRLDPHEWQAMVAAQGGGCAICGRTDKSLHVDHDHRCCPGDKSCGKCVRKLLCGNCNRGIGLFGDSPELMEAAAAYLRS